MSLSLSSGDLDRLASLQEALLSPLEHQEIDDWFSIVLEAAEALFMGDRSALMLPTGREIHYRSESIPSRYMEPFEKSIDGFEPGALRFSDEQADEAWSMRRQRGLRVWSIPMLSRLSGRPLDGFAMYEEVVKPAGLAHSSVATVPVPRGEAFLGVSVSRAERATLSEEDMLSLMEIVVPSFEAGVRSVVSLARRRTRLAEAVDELDAALAIHGARGREVHRTAKLRELLTADPEGELVERRIGQLARSVLRFRLGKRSEGPNPPPSDEVATETARYALRASLVGRGILGLDHAVVIIVDRLTPRLPSQTALVECYDLTPRQAEVALLLAEGLSDQEIGERLGISHHTVRHHAEWVFAKIGIHTRKALALELLR